MRRPLVAGNWKMHGTCASVAELVEGLRQLQLSDAVEVAVMPSFVHLAAVEAGLRGSRVEVGAQDCSVEAGQAARTGEVSASQLADMQCRWVLVGHSERRSLLGESDAVVAGKFAAALQGGLVPVLCVGETLQEREAGETLAVVGRQVERVLDEVGVENFARAVIAYEPVWAIGSGLSATAEQAQEVHAAIRAQLASKSQSVAGGMRILYGGSVKPSSAAELFGMPDIDGGLIGGASLNADDFGAICRAAGC